MKKRFVAFLLVLIMVLGLLPVSAMAADGTIDYGGVTLYTEKRPTSYTFLRSNEVNAVTRNVGETGIYQRLPRETCVHTSCGTVLAEFIPDYYSASTTTVELSDPTVLKDLGYTISGWNGNDEYKDKPCLTFNYTAAKPGTTTVKLTFYYNYNHAGASGYCNGCGGLTGYNDNFVWWQETTSFTVTVGDGEVPKPPLIPVPSYGDLKSAIGQIQVKDVSTLSCGTENYDLIDNTQSESFNWTKTARLDQPGKYDVTIKTAPYVAKYNSEKTKTHELNNANQTTLRLVISYENNKWVLDDGRPVIEVKHKESTPTDMPKEPTERDVNGVTVDVVCVATTGKHDKGPTYPLGFVETPETSQHTIGEVVSDGAGGYICQVTVQTERFVQKASELFWRMDHIPTAPTIKFNLTYDKNSNKWVKPTPNPRIEATHEVTPPTDTFTVTYTDGVEGEVFEDKVTTGLKYGDATPEFGKDPFRRGYTFTGWQPAVAEKVTRL